MSQEGRLFEHPLPELLLRLRRGRASGLLELGPRAESMTVAIRLNQGMVLKVSVENEIPSTLANALKSIKALNAETLRQAQTRVAQIPGLTLDAVLLEMGGISQESLIRARAVQLEGDLRRVVERLPELRRFRLTPEAASREPGVDPAGVMAGLIISDGPETRTIKVIKALGALRMRDGFDPAPVVKRFNLDAEQQLILELLATPRRCDDLLDLPEVKALKFARLARGLRLTGDVVKAAEDQARAVVPVEVRRIKKRIDESQRERASVSLQDLPVPLKDKKLLQEIESMLAMDYFTLFDLDTETTNRAVNVAFLELAQTWHPDRVQGRHPRLVAAVTTLFARITNARDTLEDKVLRETYLAHIRQNSERTFREQELSPEGSRLECDKAKVLMRKKEFWNASIHLKRAAQLDPKNGSVRALELLCHIRDPETAPKKRILCLEEAGKDYPNEPELVFERAMEHFNRRNLVTAEELMLETLSLRPHHREAERYLKVIRMRMKQPQTEAKKEKKKGFFGF